jgi:hypothetical protein
MGPDRLGNGPGYRHRAPLGPKHPWFGLDSVYVGAISNLGFDKGTVPYENHGVQNEPPHRSIAPTLGPDGARSIGKWTGLPTSGPAGAKTPLVRCRLGLHLCDLESRIRQGYGSQSKRFSQRSSGPSNHQKSKEPTLVPKNRPRPNVRRPEHPRGSRGHAGWPIGCS